MDKAPVNEAFAAIGIPFRFDVEHVTVINAGTIILLQVLVSRIVKDIKPLPTMVSGIFIGSLGFLCLAFASNAWIFILGIDSHCHFFDHPGSDVFYRITFEEFGAFHYGCVSCDIFKSSACSARTDFGDD